MGNTYYNEQEQYQLNSQDDTITIHVSTGNGMESTYKIYKNGSKIATNSTGNAGIASTCNGSEIKVIAVIDDTVSQTNWTNVKIDVKEGNQTKTYSYQNDLPQNSDTAIYTILINMSE
jgi:hypothetical protein